MRTLVKPFFPLSAKEAVDDLAWLALSSDVQKQNGKYFVRKRVTSPKLPHNYEELSEKLWDVSCGVTGFKNP